MQRLDGFHKSLVSHGQESFRNEDWQSILVSMEVVIGSTKDTFSCSTFALSLTFMVFIRRGLVHT
jgi:hypothetical protein